ncbi:golgin subfamily A member 6-like protein 22 [Parambassis ranga]|uniref:Golgin subfamily A member 6-like protein 22 n=1 Tax=Parambassis ranga TaxID=210632 RepID=A0A6P7KLV1_9TELE|nr:golgin subfamily A member 6-like protein 22 [Parambassis ranga]
MLTTLTSVSGPNLPQQAGNASNLPCPSGETEIEVALQGPGRETNNIKQLLNEVSGLYQQRLRCLELDAVLSMEERLQKKVDFLQSYVNDLQDQNQVLVQTIEDLQREAGHKDFTLRTKQLNSDHVLGASDVELDELIGTIVHSLHSAGPLVQIESEDLKIQLQNKDIIIADLERKLQENLQQKEKWLESSKRLVNLQSELSCLQRIHKDSMREIAEKDICITKLQANIQQLQQEGADTHAQLSKWNLRTKVLQEELKRKEEELRQNEKEQKMKDEKERMKREQDWKEIEEERQAFGQAVKQWAEKAAILNSELESSRKQVEWQSREFDQKEEALLTEAETKMVCLKNELSVCFERRLEEKEGRINQLTEELTEIRQKMKEREDHVRHLDQDVVGLRATQDSLKRTLAMKEKHTQQLVQHNTQLKEVVATLQSELQISESMLNEIRETLDQTRTSLNTDRQQRQEVQDQLHKASKEVERLQLELTHVHRTTEKKIQKKEIKMCALAKELTESKRQHSDCQKELLRKEEDLEKLCKERDELKANIKDQSRERVHLSQTKDRLEADLAVIHQKLHTSHLEVRSREQLILQLRAEIKAAEQKHQVRQKQVTALEGEVRHLNHKVRAYQEEACQISEKVGDIERLKDQKEKEQQRLHDQLHISQQQVKTFEQKLEKQEVEIEALHQQLKGAKDELKEAHFQTQETKETAAIFKQKYTAAIEKVHRVQGQVELLEEELRYSQQQLKESQSTTHMVKEELAELERRYQEKVGHWENTQEALDQLTDELQAKENLLRESEQKVDHFKSLIGSLQDQKDKLQQQKLTVECDLRLYQQNHSHSDEEYLSLFKLRQQLQKRCTEQVERLAECEKAILQMKSELERQNQEKVDLKLNLAASHKVHQSTRSQLEQEVKRLKKEVTCLQHELGTTQKPLRTKGMSWGIQFKFPKEEYSNHLHGHHTSTTHVQVTLLRKSEEEVEEARRESAQRSRELDLQRVELQRLQEELQKEEEKMRGAVRENHNMSTYIRQLSHELEELRSKHKVTAEELAARAEEARRMEGRLSEGKLAEEKIRSMAASQEREATELKKNLQQAVDQRLKAERERQDAQDQVNTLESELEGTRSDNVNLRNESQRVMTKVNLWITEQKACSESLTAQLKAQHKALLIVTEEKEHLQEANDTLKAEVKTLKEVVDEKERDMERFKAQIRDRGIQQDGKTVKGCVALSLSKIEDMQTRLQSNLEAIGMLNQQLSIFSEENKQLRRQLKQERSMRRRVERLPPPPPTYRPCSSTHLPFSLGACPPPPLSASLPSSLCLPNALNLDLVVGDTDGIQSSGAGAERPGESQALVEAFWIRPTVSLEDAWSGRTIGQLAK